MTFGKRLKELREEKKLTQEELGKLLNLSKANISKYEAESIQPNLESIEFLADFFNVSVDYLLGRNVKRNPYEIAHETKEKYYIDVTGLPENAVKQVEEYAEFVKLKHGRKGK